MLQILTDSNDIYVYMFVTLLRNSLIQLFYECVCVCMGVCWCVCVCDVFHMFWVLSTELCVRMLMYHDVWR